MKKNHLIGKDYERIEEEVTNLIEDMNIKYFPFNCFEVASLLNIEVKSYSSIPKEDQEMCLSKTEDGYSTKNGNIYIIYYNDKMPLHRIKFTIWHEIGHIQLGHFEENEKSDELMEKEANHFAAYAMAPICLIFAYKLFDPFDISYQFDIGYEFASHKYQHYLNVRRWPSVVTKICNDRLQNIITFNLKEEIA